MESSYYDSPQSVQDYIKAAKDSNGSMLIERIKPFLPEGSSMLEIGSGPGNDFEILSKYYEVTGSDLSDEFLRHLNTRYPTSTFLKVDALNIDVETQFDAIYSNKVLQHLDQNELLESLKNQSERLNHDGIICHSFWRGEGIEDFENMRVQHYEKADLERIVSVNFELLVLEYYQEFDPEDSILLLAVKKR